ncbi:MAG: sigma-54-dependent Fis family transcriptional regulator, partial [Lentisphaeria bacterium]|nr:sigma-54-dependent Fis family transcriptional regulator [Lentisphaeria bacterium]
MGTQKPTILIIDDERNTREGLRRAFERKYAVVLAESAARGLAILDERHVDVVLTDLRMPGIDGMAFTREVTTRPDPPLVIMLTAYGTLQTAVDAMKIGAYDYLAKPIDLANLEMVIDRGLESRHLREQNEELRRELDRKYGFDSIIGNSKAMDEVFEMTRQVAVARSTVLITGESGTGKELIAHAIHRLSPRASGPFVVVHCASLNENLLESELFGHEKGAYTGAHERTVGRFEKADGGTL